LTKTTSAAVIIKDPVTRNLLGCHPTGKPKYVFDLPKGNIDSNETPIEAAVRECFEECNLAIDKSELRDLGQYPYVKYKDIHFFYTEKQVDLKSLKCTSYFQNDEGQILTEMNGYTLLQPDSKSWYPSLRTAILKVLQENDLID
jgi:8-oxo-dGTP pyrophosphatase MutT (NUDIX family)